MKIWNVVNPDYIFYNGSVYSADINDTVHEAVAVSGNKIMAVGTNKEILSLESENTKLVDMKGNSMIPGINDGHNHPWEAGLMLDGLVLFGINSIKELQNKIADKVNDVPEGSWIQGGSYIESQFIENRKITRWDLDSAAPNNPVTLERIFGACVVNSKALHAAKITKDTPNPENGEIEKDEKTGEPTGVLNGSAVLLVRGVMPGPFGSDEFGAGNGEPSVDLIEKSIKLAYSEYIKYGITSSSEPGVSSDVCKAYHNLLKKGELACRVNLLLNWHGFTIKQNESQLDKLIGNYNFSAGYGNEWLMYSGLKMAIDGGLTSGTALKSWPYKGETELREFNLRLDLNKLDKWVKEAHDSGWNVAIHVMGDIAIEKAVDAIYKAVMSNPRKHQHQIVHAYYPNEESLRKMQEAKIMVTVQPSFIYGEADGYENLLPEEKRKTFLPIKTYLEKNIVTSMSTDMPCAHFNPFWNMYSAVTRKGMRGYCLGTEECVTIKEAVKMMTYFGACLTDEQHIKGSIEPGKLADLVMLDHNLNEIEHEEIRNIMPVMTMLDGKIAYEK